MLIVLLIAPSWLFLDRKILRPLELVMEADRRRAAGDLSGGLIPEDRIPDHEVGEMMRSRNRMLRQIDEMQSMFRRNLKHLAALSGTAVRLVEAGELQVFLEHVLDQTLKAVIADAAEMALTDQDRRLLVLRTHQGLSRAWEKQDLSRPVECLCGHVLETRQSLVANDLTNDP